MFDDLKTHLEKGNVIRLYRSKYNNVVRTLYILIKSVINKGGTYIEIDDARITWGKNDQQFGEISLEKIPDGGKIHAENMLLILDKDKKVQKYITANKQEDKLVCIIANKG